MITKRGGKNFLRAVCFITIGFFIFLGLQNIFTPIWNYKDGRNRDMKQLFNGLDYLSADIFDVLFLGTSHSFFGVSPMVIYRNKKICSYNYGTSGQNIESSYFLLKTAYEKQNPSIVMLEVSGLWSQRDSFWRYVLDNFHLSKLKIEMAYYYGLNKDNSGMLSALIPMYLYHSRWVELGKNDLTANNRSGFPPDAGYHIVPFTNANSNTSNEKLAIWENRLLSLNKGTVSELKNGKKSVRKINTPLYNQELSASALEWLDKINDLCKSNGSKLILFKVPSSDNPIFYESTWTPLKHSIVKREADARKIPFLDLQYDVSLNINWNIDTTDRGHHLNQNGALKVSAYLAKYLSGLGVKGKPNAVYDEALKKYEKVVLVADLELCRNFISYLKLIKKHAKDWTIAMAVSDDGMSNLTKEEYLLLESLGLKILQETNFQDSYIALIDGGKVVYEGKSDRRLEYRGKVRGLNFFIQSSGWYNYPQAIVEIGSKSFKTGNSPGIEFVIMDNASKKVIDAVLFNTHSANKNSKNLFRSFSLLNDYEEAVCY